MVTKKYTDYMLKEADEIKPATKGEKRVKVPEQKMILSDKFKEVLNTIQNIKPSKISQRLLDLEKSDKLFDFSYVDVDDDGENVSFLQSSRIERFTKEEKPIDVYWSNEKMRTKQKIGRFITQVLPSFSENAVQLFSKKFKSIVKESEEAGNFEMVEGEDIIYWYDYRNYESESGTMGSSCMSGPEAGRYLNCYAFNPEQCKMLILKNTEGDKIRGRALIWKLSKPKDKIFMDRVYVNNSDDEMLFTNYAKRTGWIYKDEQKYGATNIIMPGEGSKDSDLEVILDNTNYDLYPYVDTLRYYYPSLKMMANHMKKKEQLYTLTDTDGNYEEWGGGEDPMVYDGYNKKDIPESRALWCRYDNAYITATDAIRMSYNNSYVFPDSPHAVWSEYTKKMYAKDDCDFSKVLNSWIWRKYVVDVYHDKDKKTSDKTHRFELNKTIGKVGEDYYDIDILKVIGKKQVIKDGKKETLFTYDFKSDDDTNDTNVIEDDTNTTNDTDDVKNNIV